MGRPGPIGDAYAGNRETNAICTILVFLVMIAVAFVCLGVWIDQRNDNDKYSDATVLVDAVSPVTYYKCPDSTSDCQNLYNAAVTVTYKISGPNNTEQVHTTTFHINNEMTNSSYTAEYATNFVVGTNVTIRCKLPPEYDLSCSAHLATDGGGYVAFIVLFVIIGLLIALGVYLHYYHSSRKNKEYPKLIDNDESYESQV